MKTVILSTIIPVLLIICACSEKNRTIVIKFEGDLSEEKFSVKDLDPDLPSDWSGCGYLTFELNSSTPQRFDIRLYDAEGVRILTIQPFQKAWVRASVPLIHFQERNTEGTDMAAIWKTPLPGCWIGFSSHVGSINNIDSVGIAMRHPAGSPILELRNIQLTTIPMDSILSPIPLVDEFGQWIPDNWPGKVKKLNDLISDWREEENSYANSACRTTKYGGFLDSRVEGTGFFRVEKIEGIWWFVDPEGYLFFSAGSTCINSRSELARLEGREYLFAALPPDETDVAGQTASVEGRPSIYTWNLYRRFGPEWYNKWLDLTVNRMDSWGLNTIGNWSDPALGRTGRKAYVVTLRGWGIETGLMGMPDVYAPDFEKRIDESASRQCSPYKDDPYMLGYFIGNEPPWPERESELADLILAGENTPMKSELIKFLDEQDTPERRKEFVYNAYKRFINIVNEAVRKHDPDHLNLGIRFGGSPPDDIIEASKGFDVFSINIYGYSADHEALQRINDLTGLPVIIGEFHFGMPGRGMAPGLAQVLNQEERGAAYQYYVENAAAHPALIGTHWFQWTDQPSTGRFDGENYNIGFVDVTDRPYHELVNASKETSGRLYNIHMGKEAPVNRRAVTH